MADTETTGNALLDYLQSPVESSFDADGSESSLPPDPPLDDEQSTPAQEEVAPDPDAEQPEVEESQPDVSPEVESSPEPPVAPQVNWDSPENPHLEAARQLEAIRQLAEERQREQAQKDADERYTKAVKGLIEVDESDVDALAGDLIADIRETAAEPYQQEISMLSKSFTALVAAIRELPAETQEALKGRAGYYGTLGETPQDIERAHTVLTDAQKAAQTQVAERDQTIRALKAELAKKAIVDAGEDRVDPVISKSAPTSEPTSMDEYLRQPDEAGRTLHQPYGRQRQVARTG